MKGHGRILDLFDSFRCGMQSYFMLPEVPHSLKAGRGCTSGRITRSLAPFFPGCSTDSDALGADILVWNEEGAQLALFWSSSYCSKEKRLRAIAFHEKEAPPLTLAVSLFPGKDHFLVYRIEKGYIDYLHIDKSTLSEDILRRCTIDEGKIGDDGQLRLSLRRRKATSARGR